MFEEFQFEDIIFGVFPKAASDLLLAYGFWPKNSVGDIVEMLMQMLEVSFEFTSSAALDMIPQHSFKGSRFHSLHEYCPSCEYIIV
jgi:hypothetical protein